MRICQQCHCEDRPWIEEGECSCGLNKTERAGDPTAHQADCRCLGHEVVQYPVRMARNELAFDDKLPRYYAQQGWVLMKHGGCFYRVKILCRDCVGKEELALAHRRDYERVCKEARGLETKTYAQMLAQQ